MYFQDEKEQLQKISLTTYEIFLVEESCLKSSNHRVFVDGATSYTGVQVDEIVDVRRHGALPGSLVSTDPLSPSEAVASIGGQCRRRFGPHCALAEGTALSSGV